MHGDEYEGEGDGALATMIQPPTGAAMQRVQGSFVTAVAVQKPRSLAVSLRKLEEEATLSGESFYYGWNAGGEKIEGPSVKLANAAVRCWGNCSVEMLPLHETADSWVFTAAFIDYETGFTLQRQFRQSKASKVYGKHDEERKADIRFQIGQSKAVRNVILNALPAGMIDRAMEVAKDGARKKLEKFIAGIDREKGQGQGIVQAVDMVIRGLAKCGVKEAAILAKLEVAERKAIDVDRLLILRSDLAAIDAGEARADELYPQTKTDQLADKMAGGSGSKDKPGNGDKAPKDEAKKKTDQKIPGVDED